MIITIISGKYELKMNYRYRPEAEEVLAGLESIVFPACRRFRRGFLRYLSMRVF
jgi:hypothetical protein